MISKQSLPPGKTGASSNGEAQELARREIESLVRERLVGRKIDGVGFVEELLAITTSVGELSCSPATNRGLRFELAGGEPFEIDLDANRGKLRMLCARLAVLCKESGGEFMPYGGEGAIRRTAEVDPVCSKGGWKARWTNTPDKQEFTLSAVR